MNQIEQDIKNKQFHNFYLLYGEEDYLKNKYANLLINNIVENKDSMNYSYYEDKDIDSNDIIGTAITLPFFADKRIAIGSSHLMKISTTILTRYAIVQFFYLWKMQLINVLKHLKH